MLHQTLICREKVLLPLLHIELGLMENFVRVMNDVDNRFSY